MLAPVILSTVGGLEHFLCENIRTARRFVSLLKVHPSVELLKFDLLDKDTPEEKLPELFSPLMRGADMGLLSESGSPAVADPGALAVNYAHRQGITVIPLPGPSSIVLALMASGLNGQQFAFHGYLPVDAPECAAEIRRLETESREKNQTQIFIETPYRNNKLLAQLLKHLSEDTLLCIGANITSQGESIRSKKIQEWKNEVPVLEKVPITFLFLAVGK